VLPRRLFHVLAGSAFPLAALWAPEGPLTWVAVGMAALVVTAEAARFRSGGLNRWLTGLVRPLMKEQEHRVLFGSTYSLISTVVVFFAIDQPQAILALFYLSLGDPAAASVGERWGRRRLFGKSLEGSAAFLLVSLAIGSLLVATELETTYAVMVAGACAATLAELVPMGLDDNLKAPLAAAGAMTLTAHFWG